MPALQNQINLHIWDAPKGKRINSLSYDLLLIKNISLADQRILDLMVRQ
jgi:hypothetical protein